MKLFKKLGTYFSMLTLVLSGASFKSSASEGEEGAEGEGEPKPEGEGEVAAGGRGRRR